MKTRFTVNTASELRDGSVMVSGSVKGPFLTIIGQEGNATTPEGNIKVLITGIGVINPEFLTKERQGILVKMLEGKSNLLVGATLDFGEQEPQRK